MLKAFMLTILCAGLLVCLWPGAGFGVMAGAPAGAQSEDLFVTSHSCFACHNGLSTSAGEDVSIGSAWRSSMMANAARDPYWHAAVRREVIDHPAAQAEIEDECSKCHMPMARYEAHVNGGIGSVFDHLPVRAASDHEDLLAADGVSCALCHQITDEGLGTAASLVGGFVIDADPVGDERPVYGPFEIDDSRIRVMRSATGFTQTEASHIQSSEFCATCHTLITHALGENGEVIGELPEQVPYQEWLHSDYAETRSCQDCHMPVVSEATSITSVLGEAREGLSRHNFIGSNFFMMQVFQRHRSELGVEALPQELQLAVTRTRDHLASESARVRVERATRAGTRLEFAVSIENRGGHKLPTAYPSRRAWLEVNVTDSAGAVVFSSGALDPSGSIGGNDNDADPSRFEPHYEEITAPDQVQIYESMLVDASGSLTTGLLSATGYTKDNRLLPAGFEKETADPEIAVHGNALTDPDFRSGGDLVRYSVDVRATEGPLSIEAVLWYQPIGYRWAENLRPYDAPEPQRFVGYYTSMSEATAAVLARAGTSVD